MESYIEKESAIFRTSAFKEHIRYDRALQYAISAQCTQCHRGAGKLWRILCNHAGLWMHPRIAPRLHAHAIDHLHVHCCAL